MLHSAKEISLSTIKRFGFQQRKFGDYEYVVNIRLAIPITACTTLVAALFMVVKVLIGIGMK